MEEELEETLVKKYPDIFKDHGGDPRKTCMAWGLAVGDGWYVLLDDLCGDLKDIIGKKDIQVIAHQVKEKFGGLRFYYGTSHDVSWFNKLSYSFRMWICKKGFAKAYWAVVDFRKKIYRSPVEKISARIRKAEADSYTICEDCGDPGERSHGGWVVTLCNNCKETRDKDYGGIV